MRRSIVIKQVKYFYDFLNLEVTDKNSGGNSYKVIQNWYNISTALYKLNEYTFIGNSIQDIFDLGASYQSSSKTISISANEYSNFVIKLNIVKAKCEAMIDSGSSDEDINEIYVKLPNQLNDLNKLSSIIDDLDLSFNKCPVLFNNIGSVSFKRVEEGSNWLVLGIAGVITTAKVLDWIANFIKSCNEIRLQNKTIRNLDLDNILKSMEIDEKELKKCKENFIKNEELKIRDVCLEKIKQIDFDEKTINPEDEARIVHCMNTLMQLMDEGVELYPSSNASEEIKLLFPKQEEFKQIEESKKLLDNKK